MAISAHLEHEALRLRDAAVESATFLSGELLSHMQELRATFLRKYKHSDGRLFLRFFLASIVPFLLFEMLWRNLIYPLFVSSLRKIPQVHWSARFSSFWILYRRWTGRENETLEAAHRRLGPVIRLGPKEVSVNSFDGGLRAVYSGGFEKGPWYANYFDNYGIPNMFSMSRSRPHSDRKRLLAHVYSKSYLQSSEDFQAVSAEVLNDRLMPILDSAVALHKPIEILETLYSTTMDLVTGFAFGLSNSTNFLEHVEEAKHWLLLYQKRHVHHIVFWAQELRAFTTALSYMGIRLVPRWVDSANAELEAWCLEICDKAQDSINSGSIQKKTGDNPIAFKTLRNELYKQVSAEGRPSTSKLDSNIRLTVASEMLDHLAAGHETSAITLTYLVNNLSQHPNLQRILRRELQTLPIEAHSIPSLRALDALPLLHALVQETLRLTPPIPGAEPRVTPKGGCWLGPSGDQYFVPAGVRVSASPFALHRNEAVFPSPNSWRPDRWLDDAISTPPSTPPRNSKKGASDTVPASPRSTETKERYFWAFSSGGRMCLGSNLAMAQMKLIIWAIYTRYRTTLEPGQNPEGMKPVDGYMGYPKAGKLLVNFERWDDGRASRPDSAISMGSGDTIGL